MAKRGRKKGSNGEYSRALLLEIAAEEFAEKGYHETKISSIVKRAGVTQPTFYLYFPTKDSIFQELVASFRSKLSELTGQSRLEPEINMKMVPDRIKMGLAAIFHFFKREPHLTRIGLLAASEAEEIKQQLAAQIKENLIAEQQAGYFQADLDMTIVAESLVGILERLTVTQLLSGQKSPEELAEKIVQLFLYGMAVSSE